MKNICILLGISTALFLSSCGTSVIASRRNNPTLIDPVYNKAIFRGEIPATVVTTDASKVSTLLVNDGDGNISFCRQATPDVGLELLDIFTAAIGDAARNENNSGSKLSELTASMSSIYGQGGFQLSTPTSIRYLEAAKEALCEKYMGYGKGNFPDDLNSELEDVLEYSRDIALAEAGAIKISINVSNADLDKGFADRLVAEIEKAKKIMNLVEEGTKTEDKPKTAPADETTTTPEE